MFKNKTSTFLFLILAGWFIFSGNFTQAATSVNYGTTTYFSGTENEAPPVSKPILDAGGRVSNWRPDRKNDEEPSENPEGSIFDKITDKFQTLFGSSESIQSGDEERGSLFDFQKENNGSDSSEEYWGEYIMGPRGESLENLDEDEMARQRNRFSQINFGGGSEGAAPKKSKLLFTSVEIPFDLTTQYILIGIVFFLAVGGAVGYYLWKKEARVENKKYNSEDE